MRNTISIVLTTYNGTRFLIEQLDSIRDQTLQPDEVLILDDCSTDGTAQMVRDYVEVHHLSHWRFVENETNQGWKRNFKKGFDLAQGDLILPADQDDIWHPDKVERMAEVMAREPDILMLVSNYHIFETGSDRTARTMRHDTNNDGSVTRIPITPQWYYIGRPGCTYCFRRSFYQSIVSRWDTRYPHDSMLWRYACMRGGLYLLDEELMDYRRHGDNATSNYHWTREDRITTLKDYQWFNQEAVQTCEGEDLRIVTQTGEFLQLRLEILQERHIWKWPRLLVQYREYYPTHSGVLADLMLALR